MSDCSAALQLDGVIFQGAMIKIKRPKDYVPQLGVSVRVGGGGEGRGAWVGAFCLAAFKAKLPNIKLQPKGLEH